MKVCCIFVALLAGCATPHELQPASIATPTAIREPDSREGVSKDQAEILARSFYREHYDEREGGVLYIGETATHWLFQVVIGIAAPADKGTIYVSKTSRVAVVIFKPK